MVAFIHGFTVVPQGENSGKWRKKMNKFMTRLLAVILILAMAITGCSAPAEPEETNNEETVAPENTTGD